MAQADTPISEGDVLEGELGKEHAILRDAFGTRTWPVNLGSGLGQWTRPVDLASGLGQWTWPVDLAGGLGKSGRAKFKRARRPRAGRTAALPRLRPSCLIRIGHTPWQASPQALG